MRKTRLPLGLAAFALLATACVPATDTGQSSAVSTSVPPGFAEFSGIPAEAVIFYKVNTTEHAATGLTAFLTFYANKVSPAQLQAAPARICNQLAASRATFEFIPTAQKPGRPPVQKIRINCNGN